jgi:hypothetical protein
MTTTIKAVNSYVADNSDIHIDILFSDGVTNGLYIETSCTPQEVVQALRLLVLQIKESHNLPKPGETNERTHLPH